MSTPGSTHTNGLQLQVLRPYSCLIVCGRVVGTWNYQSSEAGFGSFTAITKFGVSFTNLSDVCVWMSMIFWIWTIQNTIVYNMFTLGCQKVINHGFLTIEIRRFLEKSRRCLNEQTTISLTYIICFKIDVAPEQWSCVEKAVSARRCQLYMTSEWHGSRVSAYWRSSVHVRMCSV